MLDTFQEQPPELFYKYSQENTVLEPLFKKRLQHGLTIKTPERLLSLVCFPYY